MPDDHEKVELIWVSTSDGVRLEDMPQAKWTRKDTKILLALLPKTLWYLLTRPFRRW